MAPGVVVRHVNAGPFEGLAKEDLPAQMCAFTTGVLRAEAAHAPGYYDLVHSHYWLSGQVGWLAKERWGVEDFVFRLGTPLALEPVPRSLSRFTSSD